MFGVHWADCHCKAGMGGSQDVSTSQFSCTAEYDMTKVIEASVSVRQEFTAPDYCLTLYREVEEDPPQFQDNEELMVVPKQFKRVFYDCDADFGFAGMANPKPTFGGRLLCYYNVDRLVI